MIYTLLYVCSHPNYEFVTAVLDWLYNLYIFALEIWLILKDKHNVFYASPPPHKATGDTPRFVVNVNFSKKYFFLAKMACHP